MTETAWVIVGSFCVLALVFAAGWFSGSILPHEHVESIGFGTAGSFVDDFGDEIDVATGLAIIRAGPQRPTLKEPPPGFYDRRRPVRPIGAPPPPPSPESVQVTLHEGARPDADTLPTASDMLVDEREGDRP